MILIYADGSRKEAILLARTDNKLRVAVRDAQEPLELTNLHGTWVSEECEPVHVEFAWQGKRREQILTEAECICSHDLAAHLLHLLWNGQGEEPRAETFVDTGNPLVVRAAAN